MSNFIFKKIKLYNKNILIKMEGCHYVKKLSNSPSCRHENNCNCFVRVNNPHDADNIVCDSKALKPLNKSANSWFWFSFSILVIISIFLAFFFFSIFFINGRKK